MLTVYLIALAIGGTLLGFSVLGGGDHDADFDADMDADVDADADVDGDADGGHDAFDFALAWLPVASLRFWTFFAAFFGLTGTLLLGTKLAPPAAVLPIALGVGYLSGLGIHKVYKKLSRERVDSSVGTRDYLGAAGKVVLPIGPGKPGKIRLQLKGRTVELTADVEDDIELATHTTCVVFDVRDDGRVVVTKAAELTE